MWIARDLNNDLFVYKVKPERFDKKFGFILNSENDGDWYQLNKDDFSEITWENSPVEINGIERCYTVNERKQDEFIQ